MTRNRSLYYNKNGNVAIAVRHKLHLYNKQTVGLTTPKQGLAVGYVIGTTCAIIHELTHYIQGMEGRKFSEVETTQNEIDYLKEKDPYWYSRLVKSSANSEKKKQRMVPLRMKWIQKGLSIGYLLFPTFRKVFLKIFRKVIEPAFSFLKDSKDPHFVSLFYDLLFCHCYEVSSFLLLE